jgi:hypothetical protein
LCSCVSVSLHRRYYIVAIACVGLVNLVAACVAHTPRLSPLKAVTGIPGAAARGLLAVGVGGVALPFAHLAMRFARCAHRYLLCLSFVNLTLIASQERGVSQAPIQDWVVHRCLAGTGFGPLHWGTVMCVSHQPPPPLCARALSSCKHILSPRSLCPRHPIPANFTLLAWKQIPYRS